MYLGTTLRVLDARVASASDSYREHGQLVARNEDHIAVKWPAGRVWDGRGMPQKHFPSRTFVYRIDRVQHQSGTDVMTVLQVLEWKHTRQPAANGENNA